MSRLVSIGICAIGISLLHVFGTRDFISRIAGLYNKTLATESRPVPKTKQRKARTGKRRSRVASKNRGNLALSSIISTSLNKQLDDAITHVLGAPEKRKKQPVSKGEAASRNQIDNPSDNMWSRVNYIRSRQQQQQQQWPEYSYSDIRNAFEMCQQNMKASGVYPAASPVAERQKQAYVGTISCLHQEIEGLRVDQSSLWFLHSIL